MKIKYDAEVDVLRIIWSSDTVEESDENEHGVILDYNEKGTVIGVEILNASEKVESWQEIEDLTAQNF